MANRPVHRRQRAVGGAQALVIVEASGKQDLLRRRLAAIGLRADVIATVGHIADNPKSLRPILLDDGLAEQAYAIRSDRTELAAKIQAAAARADEIFLAMDDDQEGDAIAHDVAVLIGEDVERAKRVRLRALGEQELRVAFANACEPDYEVEGNNAKSRRIIDRAIGSTFSLITESITVPVGRVQSSLLASLSEVPPVRGEFVLPFRHPDGRSFTAELAVRSDAQRAQLLELAAALRAGAGTVRDEWMERLPAATPWTHEDVVAEAALRLHLDVGRAEAALQLAYEAGRVSYPRSRARAYTEEAIELAGEIASNNRCAFDPALVPVHEMSATDNHPHESPRPLTVDVQTGRSLSLMDASQAIEVLLTRNLIECGQTKQASKLRVDVDGLELDFSYIAKPPMRNWAPRQKEAGFQPWATDVALLRYMAERRLGRSSTSVAHTQRFLERNLIEITDAGIGLNEKGRSWLDHARASGLGAETSSQIEAALDGRIEDPHQAAQDILESQGLLARVQLAILRQAKPERAVEEAYMGPEFG